MEIGNAEARIETEEVVEEGGVGYDVVEDQLAFS